MSTQCVLTQPTLKPRKDSLNKVARNISVKLLKSQASLKNFLMLKIKEDENLEATHRKSGNLVTTPTRRQEYEIEKVPSKTTSLQNVNKFSSKPTFGHTPLISKRTCKNKLTVNFIEHKGEKTQSHFSSDKGSREKLDLQPMKSLSRQVNGNSNRINDINNIQGILESSMKEAFEKQSKVQLGERFNSIEGRCPEAKSIENFNTIENDTHHQFDYLSINESHENLINRKEQTFHKASFKCINENANDIDEWVQTTTPHLPVFNPAPRTLGKIEKIFDSCEDSEDNLEEEYHGDINTFYYKLTSFNSSIFFVINLFVLIVHLFNIVVSPIYYCIYYSSSRQAFFVFGCFIDIIMVLSMVLKFIIPYEFQGKKVLEFKLISINYVLFGSFFADVFLAIPYNIFNSINHNNSRLVSTGYFDQLCYWGSWSRVLGIIELWKTIDKLILYFKKEDTDLYETKSYMIGKVLLFWIIVIHILSSFWLFIGNYELMTSGKGWLSLQDKEGSFFTKYTSSFYFNVVTILTVGYGDISGCTIFERSYLCLFLILSNLLYSLLIGWISRIIYDSSKLEELFNEKKIIMDDIVSQYHISETLEKKILSSLISLKRSYQDDIHTLLQSLPQKLRKQVYHTIYERKLKKIKFLQNKSYEFILFCAQRLQHTIIEKKEILTSIGDIFTEIYIINSGALGMYLSSRYGNYMLIKMHKGYHFGDVNMSLNERSELTIKTLGASTELFILKKTNYLEIKKEFPEQIKEMLSKSIEEFSNLDQLRKEACSYFERNETFEGFKLEALEEMANNHKDEIMKEESELTLRSSSSQKSLNKIRDLTVFVNAEDFQKNENQRLIEAPLSSDSIKKERDNLFTDHFKILKSNTNPNPLGGSIKKSKHLKKKIFLESIQTARKKIVNCCKIYTEDIKNNFFKKANIEIEANLKLAIVLMKPFQEDSSFINFYRMNQFKSISTSEVYDDSALSIYHSDAKTKPSANNISHIMDLDSFTIMPKPNSRIMNDLSRSMKCIKPNLSLNQFSIKYMSTQKLRKRKQFSIPKDFTRIKINVNDCKGNATSIEKPLESPTKQKRKVKIIGVNKRDITRDFVDKIESNAILESNINLFENYIKDMINQKKGDATSRTHLKFSNMSICPNKRQPSKSILSIKPSNPDEFEAIN